MRLFRRALMEFLLRFPRAGYAHSAVQSVDPDGEIGPARKLWRLRTYHSADTSLWSLAKGLKMCANMPIYRREALVDIDFISGDCHTVEDYYTACRIADAGWGNAYSRQLLGYYRLGLSSQWTISRNISAAKGLCLVFDTLERSYEKRGWPTKRIRQNRARVATELARGIFGRRGITEHHEIEAQVVLERLWEGIPDYKRYVENYTPSWRDWAQDKSTRAKKMIKANLLP